MHFLGVIHALVLVIMAAIPVIALGINCKGSAGCTIFGGVGLEDIIKEADKVELLIPCILYNLLSTWNSCLLPCNSLLTDPASANDPR